jgi:hypothetical protein
VKTVVKFAAIPRDPHVSFIDNQQMTEVEEVKGALDGVEGEACVISRGSETSFRVRNHPKSA